MFCLWVIFNIYGDPGTKQLNDHDNAFAEGSEAILDVVRKNTAKLQSRKRKNSQYRSRGGVQQLEFLLILLKVSLVCGT